MHISLIDMDRRGVADGLQSGKVTTKAPSPEVAPTTLRLVLLVWFPIHDCFSSTLPDLVFPVSLSLSSEKNTFSSSDVEHLASTYELHRHGVKVNHNAGHVGQRSFRSTLNHSSTHTHTSDRLRYLDHKKWSLVTGRNVIT